jgi:hypothetical protein
LVFLGQHVQNVGNLMIPASLLRQRWILFPQVRPTSLDAHRQSCTATA